MSLAERFAGTAKGVFQSIFQKDRVHRPEKSPGLNLKDAFDAGTVQIGDVIELETVYAPANKEGHGRRLVYLEPDQTATSRGRIHLFTEETPEGKQTLMREGFITSWKKVGHHSGHWDELLKESFGDKLS